MLARLDPADKELAGLREDFNKVLDYVNQINEIPLDQEDYTPEQRNILRKDEPKATLDMQELSRMAPAWESGHFVVPEVIDSEG